MTRGYIKTFQFPRLKDTCEIDKEINMWLDSRKPNTYLTLVNVVVESSYIYYILIMGETI